MRKVSELMTRDPVFLDPEDRISDAWKVMRDRRIRHIPVCKRDRVVGLLTQKDLLVNAQNSALLTLPVAEIMVLDTRTVTPDTDILEAAQLMLDYRISCLPVVADNRLAGILTETDCLGLLIDTLRA